MAGATVALAFTLASCTGDGDPEPRTLLDPPAPTVVATTPTPSTPRVEPAPVADSALDLALLTVPARAEYVSFTDVGAVKERLGYADLTGQSSTRDRFDFWERARADGSMLTGTRLYDESSRMSLDYGWTAEDVEWEVDFSSAETGCLQSMICDRASGYVLALRRDLDFRVVLQSLTDNGFEPLEGMPAVWVTDDDRQPFERLLVIPSLNAVAGGNEDGVLRLNEVVSAGAESAFPQAAALTAAMASTESAYLDLTGCVTLGEALGPDASDDDVADFFKKNDASNLADPLSYGVSIDADGVTSVVTTTAESVQPEQLQARRAVVDGWQSVQAGLPFADVAAATISESPSGNGELGAYDLSSPEAFVSMVLTHDAPWALCATQPPA